MFVSNDLERLREGLSINHERTLQSYEDLKTLQYKSQHQITESTSRIEESQSRMELQIQEMLKAQQRRASPIVAQSLDASSPEGRQTWMMLGRLLREEGITPSQIRENKSQLVKALKTTIITLSNASTSPESFQTAQEFSYTSLGVPVGEAWSTADSVGLLGSAPSRESFLSSTFENRGSNIPGAWEDDENIDEGVATMLEGLEDREQCLDESDVKGLDLDTKQDLSGIEVPRSPGQIPGSW